MFSVFHTTLQINHMSFMSVSQSETGQTAWKLQSSQILNIDSPFFLLVEKNMSGEDLSERAFALLFHLCSVSHGITDKNSAWGIYIQFPKPTIIQAQFLGYTFDSCNIKCERKSPNGIQIRFLQFSSGECFSFYFLQKRCSHKDFVCWTAMQIL